MRLQTPPPSSPLAHRSAKRYGALEDDREDCATHTICLPPIVHRLSTISKRARSKFMPYERSGGPSALELRFTEKSLGRVDSSDITLEDIREPESRSILLRGLTSLSDRAMRQALEARQADRESKRLRALSTAWEIEASDRHRNLLLTLLEDDTRHLNKAANEVAFFEKVLERRSVKELENDIDFDVGAYGQDLRSLSVVDERLDQLEEEMARRVGGLSAEDETPDRLNAILAAAVSAESDGGIDEDGVNAEKEEVDKDDSLMWSGRPNFSR
ncbi:hypothetical protein JVU11DRAFT_9322 [Chiua virens]|nr:hypothetical protein JVU11DRAFT_9322 [Chiua virens]